MCGFGTHRWHAAATLLPVSVFFIRTKKYQSPQLVKELFFDSLGNDRCYFQKIRKTIAAILSVKRCNFLR